MGDKETLKKVLDNTYTKASLLKLYDKFIKDWIAKSFIGKNMGFFEVIAIGESSKKEVFLELIEEFYGQEDVFLTLFETLPQEVKAIFEHLAWKGKYYLDDIEKKELLEQIKENYKMKTEPKVEYQFFNLHQGQQWNDEDKTYFYLNDEIIKVIRRKGFLLGLLS